METVLNLLLIRFALIAGAVVVVAMVVFAVALAVRRRGGGPDEVRRYAEPAARIAAQLVVRYLTGGRDSRSRR